MRSVSERVIMDELEALMAKKKNHVFIVENSSQGNSFGDRTFKVVAIIKDQYMEETLAERTFTETAYEGEHGYYRSKITKDIKAWAKENGATFTGSI